MVDVIETMLSWSSEQGSPARGLPAAAYTDEAFWKLECDTLLSQHWVSAGFAHELADPGDVVPVSVAGKPVLLLRNQQDEIAAFHNVCRHRCLKLIDQARNVGKRIRCPYHAWAYDLDGRLCASPHFGGFKRHRPDGFDPAEHGLQPVRVAVWHDWIFVNLGGNAPPFEDYARDPRLRRNPHQWNWKLLFIEELKVNAYVKVHGKAPFRPEFLVVIRDGD